MKIVYAEISGFKLHKNKRSFDFGQINHISGGNGKGKTTIAEAITWCFYGCDLAGNTKGVFDRLKNPSAKETKVVVGVEFSKDGVSTRLNFCRLRKGKTTELFINGHEAKQVDFDALLGRMELFLSIFVPGYFGNMAALEPTKARNMLVAMMPELDHAEVIAKLNKDDQARIEKIDMINPESTLRNLRSEIKELETSLENIQGKIEYLRINSMLDIPMKVFEDDERKLQTLKKQLSDLMEGGSQPFQHNLQPLQEKKAQLRARYDERKAEFMRIKSLPLPQVGDKCPECGHEFSADEAVAELDKRRAKLVAIQQECEALKEEGHALNEEIMRLSNENTNFIAEFYKEKGKKMQALQAEIEKLQSLQAERKSKLKMAEDLSLQYKICDETVAERDEKLADMQAVRNFMLQYAETQVEFVNSFLNKAEIRLFKYAQTTGEMTLDFTILYNGTEYKSLSTSEKIRCSIELAGLLNRVKGISYPVYIDNAESVEEFDEPQTQYFVATVVKRAPLKTEIVA
jgi:hypothetical protein